MLEETDVPSPENFDRLGQFLGVNRGEIARGTTVRRQPAEVMPK